MRGFCYFCTMTRKFHSRQLTFMLLAAACIFLSACLRNEFTIEFRLPANITQNYRIEYYAAASNGGKFVEGAVSIVEGKGKLNGPTRMPTIAFIYSSGDWPLLAVYAERGQTIHLEGTDDNPRNWSADGNKINEQASEWRRAHASALASGQTDSINAAVAQFVRQHPDSPTSTFLMLTYYVARDDIDGYSRLWRHISPKAKLPELLRAAASADQFDPAPLPPTPRIVSINLYARADSTVLLSPADARATIIHFRRSSDKADADATDSLARLAAAFKPKALQAVDVTFESESATAGRKVNADSLNRVKHATLFAGESSETAINLGVRRTPWFIITDSTGRAAYAGGDLTPALAAARRLARSSAAAEQKPAADAH